MDVASVKLNPMVRADVTVIVHVFPLDGHCPSNAAMTVPGPGVALMVMELPNATCRVHAGAPTAGSYAHVVPPTLTLPRPFPEMLTDTGRLAGTKVTLTLAAASIVKLQLVVLAQSPPNPLNSEPEFGDAETTTAVPMSTCCVQVTIPC